MFKGIFLKLLSLASKLLFLIMIAPNLQNGVFSTYFISLTYSMLFTKLLFGGVEEYLPTRVKGVKRISDLYISESLAFFVFIFIFSLLLSIYLSNYIALAVVIFSFSFLVNGVIRTISPNGFDLMVNLPWLIFLPSVVIFDPSSGNELLIMHLITHFFVTISILYILRVNLLWKKHYSSSIFVFRLVRDSISKSVSGSIFYFAFRTPVLILSNIYGVLSDIMSITYSVAEAFWQISMVVVNRRYAYRLNNKLKSVPISIPIIFMLLSAFVFYCISYMNIYPFLGRYLDFINNIDFALLPVFILYLFSLLMFVDARYFIWGQNRSALRINIWLTGIMFLAWAINYFTSNFNLGILTAAFCIGVLTTTYSVSSNRR
ncbi:hypothetical protein F8A90_11075 [Cobetia sp. cqz5-12]|uniref:hypothetical protein n=1 Tax=Cobetia sp. cqz5-12 TaxID=2609415 RepID=UPI0019046D47|nr:hypothetical protein [Cobetia sp. cqz5-12]QQK64612.1 hypothetical protein F8A90_11075 [Cobetia sp. cqz5-12]